jgi:hypothetical protein
MRLAAAPLHSEVPYVTAGAREVFPAAVSIRGDRNAAP